MGKIKSMGTFAGIVVLCITAAMGIGYVGKLWESSFLEDFSIIGPAMVAGCLVGEKRFSLLSLKHWLIVIVASVVLTLAFGAVRQWIF